MTYKGVTAKRPEPEKNLGLKKLVGDNVCKTGHKIKFNLCLGLISMARVLYRHSYRVLNWSTDTEAGISYRVGGPKQRWRFEMLQNNAKNASEIVDALLFHFLYD